LSITQYTKTSHTTHSQALEMPENESRNPRLVTHPRASRSSYNLKDPPEFGFRRIPGSQEALPSFSKYLERFYPKALYDYLSRRETLERELSIFHTAHPRVMEKARLEPNSVEQCRVLQTQHDELMAAYKIELSSQRRELHARYEWKYDDFCRKELLEAVEHKARYMRKLSVPSAKPTTDLVYTLDRSTGPLPSNTHREAGPRADPVAISNPEAQNPPERVLSTHSKGVPSSVELDPVPAPQGLKSSPPSVAHELPSARNPLETGTPISSPPHRPSMRVKPVEQSTKTVLSREPLKGNSLMGIMPSGRIVSVPVPKCVNTRTSGKPPIIKMKVNVEKDAKARRHSHMPKAAPTLLKSTPVSSVRARTPASSSPSSRVISTLRTPNAISTRRVTSDVTRNKIETQSRVSNVPVSQVPLVSPSSQMISTLRTTDVVNTRRGGKGTTHLNPETRTPSRVSRSTTLPPPGKLPISVRRLPSVVSQKPAVGLKVETRTRVSLKTATPRFGKIPFADGIERSDDRSKVIIGPAVEQALTLFSSEVGEGRRVTDTVVSIHDEDRDKCSPSSLTTFMLQTSAPSALSIAPMSTLWPLLPTENPIPPLEVISRRHELSVISKASEASSGRSRGLETARKRSRPSFTPSGGEGGGQLARAAAYIQERLKQCSSAFDEFVRWTPKVPPDRMMESNTLQNTPEISSAERTRANWCLPADGIERSEDCSNMIVGPAVEQALTLLSTEVGERRRVPDTVVSSIHNEEKEDKYTSGHSEVFTLPASAPVTLPVPPMRVISQLHRSVDPIPPFEAVSRRRDLNVINKKSLTSVDHSPNVETARKQSHPPSTPVMV